ncbi:MAG: Do family serine endopeptidase [Helicobacteraceae bacterium]|jgi:serine protease Do|nr:Do family serine endopeptidase [Helicobacteraceae bacterium]
MKKALMLAVSVCLALAAPKIVFQDHEPSADSPSVVSYASVLKDARKSVVNISTQKNVKVDQRSFSPFLNDPFFRQFFDNYGLTIPKDRIERSLGSGVIISRNGYVVTNNHVVEGADKVIVTIGKDEFTAKIIGSDPRSDLAVIKIEANNLTPAIFYDSDKVEVGDMVFAIGNPFGVGETITGGIVSATNRSAVGIVEYENFIQTDAAINPGNSGGALVNSTGALIGINSAILTRSGASHGVGFSIPANMVKQVASQLIENGEVVRAWLGVSIGNLDENLQEFYGRKDGALVNGVEPNSPAEKAGVKRGDLIIKVDAKTIANASDLKNTIGSLSPQKTVKLEIIRDKKTITLNVVLAKSDGKSLSENSVEYKGLNVIPLTDEHRSRLGLQRDFKGVLVEKVSSDSQAEKLGISAGDVIVQVESIEINGVEAFKKATAGGNKKRIYLYRRGAIFITAL